MRRTVCLLGALSFLTQPALAANPQRTALYYVQSPNPFFDLNFSFGNYPSGLYTYNSTTYIPTVCFDNNGNMVFHTNDLPCVTYSPVTGAILGLQMEENGENYSRNPRAVGAVAGTPGTNPTYWVVALGSNISQTITGPSTDQGMSEVQYAISGTTSGTENLVNIAFDTTTSAPIPAFNSMVGSLYAKLVSGSLSGVTLTLNINAYNSGGTLISSSSTAFTPTTGNLTAQRTYTYYLLPTGTTHENLSINASGAAGTYAFTLELGANQLEETGGSQTPSSLLIPAPGATGTVSRGSLNTVFYAYGINPSYHSCQMEFQFEQTPSTAVVMDFNDGTASNRIIPYASTSTAFRATPYNAGTAETYPSLTVTMTPPAANRIAYAIAGKSMWMAAQGGPSTAIQNTQAPLTKITNFYPGYAIGGADPLQGYIKRIRCDNRVWSPSELLQGHY